MHNACNGYNLFTGFEPARWVPPGRKNQPVYSLRRSAGVDVYIQPCNLNDPVNEDRSYEQRWLAKMTVQHGRYENIWPLYKVSDFLTQSYAFNATHISNVIGDLAERVDRILVFEMLRSLRPGHITTTFAPGADPKKRIGFTLGNTQDHVLKISNNPPNVVMLRKRAQRDDVKGLYEPIKEMDGWFFCQNKRSQHVVYLEVKEQSYFSHQHWMDHLITPSREMFPDATHTIVFMTDNEKLFMDNPWRALKNPAVQMYKKMKEEGVASVFLPHPLNTHQRTQLRNHIISTFSLHAKTPATIPTTTTIPSMDEVIVRNGAEAPLYHFRRMENGLWELINGVRPDEAFLDKLEQQNRR